MPEPLGIWIGKEEYGGVPTPRRPDAADPPHWRLEAIAATERARSLSIAPDRGSLALILDRETSDVWSFEPASRQLTRLTTGRDLQPYWEDTTPVISPDGALVAYGDHGWVWLVPTAGGPPRRLVEAGSPAWAGPERLVVGVDRDDCSRLAIVDIADPWPQPLVRSVPGLDRRGDEVEAAVSPDGRRVAFTFRPRGDLNRGEIRLAELATGETTALTGAPGVRDAEPCWSPDGRRLAFAAQRGEWWQLHVVEPGTSEALVAAAGAADLSSPAWSPDGTCLAAVRSAGFQDDLVLVDAAGGDVTELARGGTWGSPVWTADGAVVVEYEDQGTPPELRLVTPAGKIEELLAPAPAAIRAAPHVRPEPVSFPSLDGLEIHGLLFRPPGGERPAPAVVYPHGGPIELYGDYWDGHAQYFVDKGYAWLALNFRGSTGRGRSFQYLNHGDWGVGDKDDCLAAADFLRTLDWVDGDRLAILGASYGSYLALCAVADDPEHRFRAAVCKYGEANLLSSWTQGDRDGVLYAGMNMMGHPSENRGAYLRGSPIHRLAGLTAPILVATGELDERVHPKQSEELVAELRRLGKTFEYVTYPTEAHGFLRAGPQVDFYRRVERFLDWHLL
ncbi:MAG TPA: prolyl oligopeptidase family serine peptidase [Gaiellaceae bacterium]